jgi:hypothetical protein
MSTLEVENMSCSEGSCDAKCLLQLPRDIHAKDATPRPINCLTQGALGHITTGFIKAHTKHLNVSYHNSIDLHARKIVDYSYLHTNKNVADILAKALRKEKHEKFNNAMWLL